MKMKTLLTTAAAIMATTMPVAAFAQTLPDSPTAHNSTAPADFINPSVTHLQQRYGISQKDAEFRISFQEELGQLAQELTESSSDDFAELVVQHAPVYKVIISFSQKQKRQSLKSQISPKLRKYVQIKQVKRSMDERNALFERIIESLDSQGRRFERRDIRQTDGVVQLLR